MRPFETVLIAVDLIAFLAVVAPLVGRRLALLVVVVAAVTALGQILLEGFRWQMVPGYSMAAVLLLLAILLAPRSNNVLSRGRQVALAGIVGVALAFSAALPMLLPVFKFPEPTGPYGIGTLTYHWTDAARAETFTDDLDDRRELMVQVWYPADKSDQSTGSPYASATDFSGITGLVHLPGWFFDHLSYVTTHAQTSVPVAKWDNQTSHSYLLHGTRRLPQQQHVRDRRTGVPRLCRGRYRPPLYLKRCDISGRSRPQT